MSGTPVIAGLGTRWLGDGDLTALAALLARCEDFWTIILGRPAGEPDARELLHAGPPGLADADKLVLGLFPGAQLVGVVDLLRDYPGPSDWYCGLLLLDPGERGRGLGGATEAAIAAWAIGQGARTMRLSVQAANVRALAFWQTRGFTIIDQVRRQLGERDHLTFRLERRFD